MNESDQRETAAAPQVAPPDFDALIASLRTAGAGRFDPVRLHYLDVLAKRASAHQGSVRHMLDAKLAQALTAFKERFERAQAEANEAVSHATQQYPKAARDLQRVVAAGDFKGVHRLIAQLKAGERCASLGALVRQLEQDASGSADALPNRDAGSPPELKTVRNFRNTFSKLSVDLQVAQALEQAPKNAGPINSHMLVLRSLALMRDISPDYLNRFMSYADTLLCLDQDEKGKADKVEKADNPKKPRAAKATKK